MVVLADQGRDLPEKGPISRLPLLRALTSRDPAQSLAMVKSVSRLKESFQPDVVLIFYLGPSVVFHLQTKRFSNAPTLVALHGSLPLGVEKGASLLGRAIEKADWVTACSRHTLSEAIKFHPTLANKSSVILNALEEPAVPVSPLSFDPPRLIYAGRLSREKGVDVAIAAFRRITERFPDALLQLAGDGPEREDLRRLVSDYDLEDRVVFLGAVPPQEMPELMANSSVVLVPSRSEGFGLTALEAAQMRRPVVATRVGGIPEVVVDNITGVLVAPEDPVGLADGISRMIENPEAAEEMGLRACRRAKKTFVWDAYVDAYDRRLAALE